MSMKVFKSPFDDRKFLKKDDLYSYMERNYSEQLNGMSPARYYFNQKNKKSFGSCIMCKKETKWNDATERYERICDRKASNCNEKYKEMFKKRMVGKYGKEHLLDSPEIQKKMLKNRKISGEYVWSDGKTKTDYTGTYEKDFLEFLDVFMKFEPSDVHAPAPQIFDYKDKDGKARFYIPDFYISSINAIIEIKSFENKHYRQRDIDLEKRKDKAIEQSGFNYIKINDKQYDEFFNFILNYKHNNE